nr:MAG TPA: hypothetical protein [Bacteriophage sp.]
MLVFHSFFSFFLCVDVYVYRCSLHIFPDYTH